MPTELFRRRDLRKIYSLFLEGMPVKDIQSYLMITKGWNMEEIEINSILDDLNQIFI